jgi:thioredoxin reductase (NADPH)
MQPGGQLTITTDVENYPRLRRGVPGPLADGADAAQAEHVGAQLVDDHIVKVDLSRRRSGLVGDSAATLHRRHADHRHRRPGALAGPAQREEFRASACRPAPPATASSIRGKEVAVVGGGNTAVEEALYLTNHASKVTLVHRRDACAPRRSCRSACSPRPRSKVVWDSDGRRDPGRRHAAGVTGVRLRNVKTGANHGHRSTACSSPSATRRHRAVPGQLEIDADGYI